MSTKQSPSEYDCHARAMPDEPLFTFLARDRAAPAVIRTWIALRRQGIEEQHFPDFDLPMLAEAESVAAAMEAWRVENYGKWWSRA